MDTVQVDLVHPCRRAGWFGAELTRWLLATAAERPGVHLRPAGVAPVAVAPVDVAPVDVAPVDVAKASFETFTGAKASFETFVAGGPDAAHARVLVVRDDGRAPDLTPLTGAATVPVALVAYGGRNRGHPALARARTVLERAGVPAATPSLGLNAAAVREDGFADADALLWSLLLDDLCAGAPGVGSVTTARSA